MSHRCTGEDCPTCEAIIAERELAELDTDYAPTGLSYQRADGTWRQGRDWHYSADSYFPKGA